MILDNSWRNFGRWFGSLSNHRANKVPNVTRAGRFPFLSLRSFQGISDESSEMGGQRSFAGRTVNPPLVPRFGGKSREEWESTGGKVRYMVIHGE